MSLRISTLLLLLFAFSFFSFGQKKKNFILYGTIQNAYLENKQELKYKDIIVNKLSLNSATGLTFSNELKNKLYFNYGFNYSLQTKWYEVMNNNVKVADENINLSFLKIPLLVQYNFVDKEKGTLFITAGPQVSFLIIEDGAIPTYTIYKDSLNNPYITNFDQKEVGGAYKQIILEGAVSFGGEVKIGKRCYFNAQLRMDRSLHNVEKKSYHYIQYINGATFTDLFSEPRLPTKTMTIGISSGIRFSIR